MTFHESVSNETCTHQMIFAGRLVVFCSQHDHGVWESGVHDSLVYIVVLRCVVICFSLRLCNVLELSSCGLRESFSIRGVRRVRYMTILGTWLGSYV